MKALRNTFWVVVAIVAVATVVLLVHAGWHWVEVHTGTVNEAGPYYGFWSGFGSDLGELTLIGAVFAGIYGAYRKVNCHDPECWRIGKHPTEGGTFVFCHHHHPDLMYAAGRKMTRDEMHQHHHERRAALHAARDVEITGITKQAVDEALAERDRQLLSQVKATAPAQAQDKAAPVAKATATTKKPGGKR